MKSSHDFPNVNPKNPDGLKPSGKPYTVMVVEDKEFHRKQIVQILESEQYKIVATAQNGKEAVEMYDKVADKLDLITTDLDMPVLDGYALLFELMRKKPQAKIVFISDETSKGVVQDLIKMGAADFILKPIQRQRLLDRVKLALSRPKGEAVDL
ncbi:MAG TPA: response regulator [Spirochaetota bacterium]|nr:response regulator [Spirochaetota bacterium]HNT12933.1 response regulator [Spirochaetota bacterium]HNV48874.1 response regulator [Spirochaetota bacterium]HOS40811.1 response regulator [Spirochaetota bacterium]HPI23598.1 response regulator [Spirochaetota bacterium]